MGVPAANIELKDGPDAKHGMPIKTLPSAGAARHCRLPEPSFLVRCDYGAAELLLQHLYPHAKPAATPSSTAGRIIGFDQTEFFDERDASTSLNETGYLYVPANCENHSNSGAKGQGADLLETRVWDALSDRVASYSASRSFRTAAI